MLLRRKEAWEWVQKNATCEQLRSIVRHDLPKAASRKRILDEIPIDLIHFPDFLTKVRSWQDQLTQKRQKLATERSVKTKPIIEAQHSNKLSWHLLQKTLRVGDTITVKVKPCVFYKWKDAHSGPGAHLIRYYDELKTQHIQCEVRASLAPFPKQKPKYVTSFWEEEVGITVRLKRDICMETLCAPQRTGEAPGKEWETWTVSAASLWRIPFQCPGGYWSVLDKVPMWKVNGYVFSTEIHDGRAKLIWNAAEWYRG